MREYSFTKNNLILNMLMLKKFKVIKDFTEVKNGIINYFYKGNEISIGEIFYLKYRDNLKLITTKKGTTKDAK